MQNLEDRLTVLRGDITVQRVDAIVNAANNSLLGGGGVDGAVHRAAGPDLLEECRSLGGCPTGEVRLTRGYRLPASYVIHTVGPIWSGGMSKEEALLAACHTNALHLGIEHDVSTIAFPAISCGAYGFPVQRAARIAIATVVNFLRDEESYEEVRFVCFDDETYEAFSAARHTALAATASGSPTRKLS